MTAAEHPKRKTRPTMVESVVDGVRGPDAAKRTLVALVQGMRDKGESVRKIVSGLNAAGILSVTGRRWHNKTVQTALAIDLGAVEEK